MNRAAFLLLALAMVVAPAASAGAGHDEGGTAHDDGHGEPAAASQSQDIVSPRLDAGEAWSYTFTAAGHIAYHCHPHPWMTAQLHIEEAPAGYEPQTVTVNIVEPDDGTYEDWGFDPDFKTLTVGDTVRFVNQGQVPHVVTWGGDHGGHGEADEHAAMAAGRGDAMAAPAGAAMPAPSEGGATPLSVAPSQEDGPHTHTTLGYALIAGWVGFVAIMAVAGRTFA